MKKISRLIFYIFVLLIIIPILILKLYNNQTISPHKGEIKNVETVKVYISQQDKVVTMNIDDYIKGVVSAEMPANFEMEALKAQAVAARTYTLMKIKESQQQALQEHKGGDICTDSTHCQAYKSKEDLQNVWGVWGYYKYWDKISRAVDETSGLVVTYQSELINPLFHSTSGGKTENSEEVFSADLPYLRSVTSPGEEVSPKYYGEVKISFEEFKNKLSQVAQDIVLKKEDIAKVRELEESEGGRVKYIQIGNKTFNGKEIRSIFSLNSTNFKISLEKNTVAIKTIGYGHGVGMSQFGANYLAKQGQKYEQILTYYYKDTQVMNIKEVK